MAGRISPTANRLGYRRYEDDFPWMAFTDVWEDTIIGTFSEKLFVVQTGPRAIERCMLMTTDPGDLVLDPTCGSGTTAFVAEQWGRRWIMVDTSRVALAVARTRLMTGRYPYYRLTDPSEGVSNRAELDNPSEGLERQTRDVSRGFVYQRVPHVTLKSIANNPEVRDGLSRDEMDAAITRHAESELLYDRPQVDPRVIRVTGPFTLESISPHRMSPAVSAGGESEAEEHSGRFVDRIIDYLRKAGVQNTVRQERLTFDRLDFWPGGIYIQASGDYTENGVTRTAAVCIGPEYGTVGPELVREAAKEAVKFADLVIVCGFAFDPHVGEESDKLGRLTILKARMNPDLSMGDELLKKTGAANPFMVFGEPDIKIEDAPEDGLVVEIRGLDIYDRTTRSIRNHLIDDIAR